MLKRNEELTNLVQMVCPGNGALVDEPLSLKFEGLAPSQLARVQMTAVDKSRRTWRSSAVYDVDETGFLDIAKKHSIDGSYRGVDDQGLIWSMRAEMGGTDGPFALSVDEGMDLIVSCVQGGELEIKYSIQRQIVSKNVSVSDFDKDGLVGRFYEPSSPAPNCIPFVYLGGSDGALKAEFPALLASHGIPALALAYFGQGDLPKFCAELPAEYFTKAIDELTKRTGHTQVNVGGLSKGGEAAFLIASLDTRVHGLISWSGSPAAWEGIGPQGAGRSSWTVGGEPLPFLSFDRSAIEIESPLRLAPGYAAVIKGARKAMFDLKARPLNVLMIAGDDDAMWPSAQLHRLAERYLAPGSTVKNLVYPGAGHAIGVPGLPTTTIEVVHPALNLMITTGGTPEANAKARAESWAEVVRFSSGP